MVDISHTYIVIARNAGSASLVLQRIIEKRELGNDRKRLILIGGGTKKNIN